MRAGNAGAESLESLYQSSTKTQDSETQTERNVRGNRESLPNTNYNVIDSLIFANKDMWAMCKAEVKEQFVRGRGIAEEEVSVLTLKLEQNLGLQRQVAFTYANCLWFSYVNDYLWS